MTARPDDEGPTSSVASRLRELPSYLIGDLAFDAADCIEQLERELDKEKRRHEATDDRWMKLAGEYEAKLSAVRSTNGERHTKAQSKALEAWTFIDAVSAMNLPPWLSYLTEEANRIRALKRTK